MLTNLQLLPTGCSFYEKLKVAATLDKQAKKRLVALTNTLKRFGIDDNETDMAEALLRLDVLYKHKKKPKPADDKAKMLFHMHNKYLRKYEGI